MAMGETLGPDANLSERITYDHTPDWGHGPNPPVPTYTEAEIAQACNDVIVNNPQVLLTKRIIRRLKENRRDQARQP